MILLQCIWSRFEHAMATVVLPFVGLVVLFGILAGLVALLVTLDPATALSVFLAMMFGALVLLLAMSAAALIGAIVACLAVLFLVVSEELSGAVPGGGQALSASDCPSAQAALALARSAFDLAVAARDAALAGAERARERASAASQGLLAAVTAIATVPFFRPDLLVLAVAAAAAAAILLAYWSRERASRDAALRAAEAALLAAATQLGVAQALVSQFCDVVGRPPVDGPGLGGVNLPVR